MHGRAVLLVIFAAKPESSVDVTSPVVVGGVVGGLSILVLALLTLSFVGYAFVRLSRGRCKEDEGVVQQVERRQRGDVERNEALEMRTNEAYQHVHVPVTIRAHSQN